MTRERAKSIDQRAFGRSCRVEAAGNLASAAHGSSEPVRMLALAQFPGSYGECRLRAPAVVIAH